MGHIGWCIIAFLLGTCIYMCVCVLFVCKYLVLKWLLDFFGIILYKTCNTATNSCQLRKALSISVLCNLYRLSVATPCSIMLLSSA